MDRPDAPGGTEGRSPSAPSESFLVPWNDLSRLDAVLARHGDRIAVVLMEAIMCNYGCCPPHPGYLEGVRALCDRYGVLLCFDEIITGFRVDPRGAQGLFGVTPDLAVFGKALGGGFPLAAVAGRKEVLQVLRDGRVIIGGTFNSFPMSLATGIATLDMLARDGGDWYRRAAHNQAHLAEGLKTILAARGHVALTQGPIGCLYLDFNSRAAAYTPADLSDSDRAKQDRFRGLMLREGVFAAGGGRWMVSGYHTDADIADTLAAAARAADDL
jgi:glutamate-1-semialdehyde 2,1-aminomutase